VIDYGTHPDQGKRYFAAREAGRTLKHPAGVEAAVDAGLEQLTNDWPGGSGSATTARCSGSSAA
jgi:hypothetical protein